MVRHTMTSPTTPAARLRRGSAESATWCGGRAAQRRAQAEGFVALSAGVRAYCCRFFCIPFSSIESRSSMPQPAPTGSDDPCPSKSNSLSSCAARRRSVACVSAGQLGRARSLATSEPLESMVGADGSSGCLAVSSAERGWAAVVVEDGSFVPGHRP